MPNKYVNFTKLSLELCEDLLYFALSKPLDGKLVKGQLLVELNDSAVLAARNYQSDWYDLFGTLLALLCEDQIKGLADYLKVDTSACVAAPPFYWWQQIDSQIQINDRALNALCDLPQKRKINAVKQILEAGAYVFTIGTNNKLRQVKRLAK